MWGGQQDAVHIPHTAQIIRRHIFGEAKPFNGFPKGCQEDSVPQLLLTLVNTVLKGLSIKDLMEEVTSPAALVIAQFLKFKCQTQAGTRQSSYCQTLYCTRDNVSSFKDSKWYGLHSCAVMCLSLLLLTILITIPVQQQLSILSMAWQSFWPSILLFLVKGLTGALLSVGQREEVPRPLTACQCIILQSRQLLVTSRCHKILPSDNPYLTSPWHSWKMVAI